MTGSLLELVAKGMEDIYLIGDAQITFFIMVYRRISNFSMYDHNHYLKGCDFSKEFKFQFDYLGDLLHKLWFVVDIPEISLEKTKPTFKYINLLLKSYHVDWDYSPQSDTSLVTLDNYNGNTINLISEKIFVNPFDTNQSILTFANADIFVNSSNLKIMNGTIKLAVPIPDYSTNSNDQSFSYDVDILEGELKMFANSSFGDIFSITGGLVTVNKQLIGSNYIYFISNISLISEFNNTILKSINSTLQKILETYNFYNTALIITKDSNEIINSSVSIFDNTNYTTGIDSNGEEVDANTLIIKKKMINGRNLFMQVVQILLTKYSSKYSPYEQMYFFPKTNNNYLIQKIDNSNNNLTRSVKLYSDEFKNNSLAFGLLLNALQSYSYDATVYNANYVYEIIMFIVNTDSNVATEGNLYISSNKGISFEKITLSTNLLTSIWVSENSNQISISDNMGNIYVSTDLAKNWQTFDVNSLNIGKIVGSSTGDVQMCLSAQTTSDVFNQIILSVDHWNSFEIFSFNFQINDSIKSIILTADGKNSTFVTSNGLIYVYNQTTNSWTFVNNIDFYTSNNKIIEIKGSTDGNYQTIIDFDGNIYISSNKWTSYTTILSTLENDNFFTTLDVGISGQRQIIGDNYGNIYISATYGSSWSNSKKISDNPILKVSIITSDGDFQSATDVNGNIYFSNYYGNSWNDPVNTTSSIQLDQLNSISDVEIKKILVPDQIKLKIDNTNTSPLFGNSLKRSTSDITDLIKFKLYDSDDIRMLFYVTFVNNLLRQKIVLTSNELTPFNPFYSTILRDINIRLSIENLKVFDPQITNLDDTLLFYHMIDSRVINYNVYSYDIGGNTDVYFNSNIKSNYDLYDKYNAEINGHTREDYITTDSYKVYKSFINDVMSDIGNNVVKSKQQIDLLGTSLRYNIGLNIKYNFNQILNNITILSNSIRTNANNFIITFFRQFSLSSNIYVPASSISFNPIIDDNTIPDNFKNILNANIEESVPTGVVVKNYFGDHINAQIKNFTTECQNLFKAVNYEDYISDYDLWRRIIMSSGSSMLAAYNVVNLNYSDYPIIPATIFGRIAFMNFSPLLVAKDIPVMIYNTFSKYGKQMMIDLGLDVDGTPTNYNNFLSLIDFRDKDRFDMPDTYKTAPDVPLDVVTSKLEIYNKIITSLMLVSYDNGQTLQVQNLSHFSSLQSQKAGGSIFLTAASLRSETYFSPYSMRNSDGSLYDISNDPLDIKYLPLEWLTQTYYHILKSIIIEKFINVLIPDNTSVQYKTTKKTLVGTLENIINCFILRSDLPLYSNYKNNNYSLLGLTRETNSVISKYKKTKEPITVTSPIYSDCLSSIWYQIQKGFIQLYNGLFNDTLLSFKYYYTNLGNTMGSIFDYIKQQLIDDDNPYYYSNGNDYPQTLPPSLLNSFVDVYKNDFSTVPLLEIDEPTNDVVSDVLNFVGEIHPAVDTNSSSSTSTNQGFNFFRLNIGDPNISTSKAYKINSYVKDYALLYDYLMSYYESHKDVLLIKNDIDVLVPYPASQQIKRKNTFQYEQSSLLINYIKNNIQNKYIEPVINKKVRLELIDLLDKTSNYWNPSVVTSDGDFVKTNPTGVYGILDVIYNSNFVGSIANVLSKISGIPQGKVPTDLIDFDDIANIPFSSYCLKQWYYGLKYSYSPLQTQSEMTYQDLVNVFALFSVVLYSTGYSNSDHLITTQSILKNKHLAKLYSSDNVKPLSCVAKVSWFLFDLVLSNKMLTSFINLKPLLQTIQNTTSVKFDTQLFYNKTNQMIGLNGLDGGSIETLQQLIINHFKPNHTKLIADYELISKFKSTAYVQEYNQLTSYYDILSNMTNTDIYYYQQSPDGISTIDVELENRLLNLINGVKPKYAWVKELGHKILKKISFYIGGQLIDSYTPELTHLMYKLTKSDGHERGYNILTGNTSDMYTYSNIKKSAKTLMIPLNFYFCKLAGSSLPLIKLLYTDIILNGQISEIKELLYIEPDSDFKRIPKLKCGIMARYIYVDDDERKLIADTKMEYLVEKFNYSGNKTFSSNNLFSVGANLITLTNNSIDLTNLTATAIFDIKVNDPIKYFVWYVKFFDKTTQQPIDILEWCNFGYCNVRNADLTPQIIKKIIKTIELKMNGVTREIAHPEEHYTHLIPYEKMMGSLENGEYVYSFALYPLLLQPSGSANYSEISDSSLIITFTKEIEDLFKSNNNLEMKMELWGRGYNILRCISGMAGFVFNKP